MNDNLDGMLPRLREMGSGNGSSLEGSEMDRQMDLESGSQAPRGEMNAREDLDDIDVGEESDAGDAVGHPRSPYADGQDIARSGLNSNLAGDPAMDQGVGGAGSFSGIDNRHLERNEAIERSREAAEDDEQ